MDHDPDLPRYQDPAFSIEKRVDDLVGRMTCEEKVSQMCYNSPAIPRLGVPEYNWWNECLHGVARAGVATVFPQSIALAASFNPALIEQISSAIADEARAKHHEAVRRNDRGIYEGLTFWTPNINIFRDPRWGRGQETYGEDPHLTGELAVAFIRGLQGDNRDESSYLKAAACAKHYAVHSGPESLRHEFDARVAAKDLWETYLPAFRRAVCEAGVEAVMGAYNRVNGQPACASKELLQHILRDTWGFRGHVVSDCGALEDIFGKHMVAATPEKAAAQAVNAGCDLDCGAVYAKLVAAVEEGLISEDHLDQAVKRLFRTRFRLGMFDPEEQVPFASIPYEANDSPEHDALNRLAACQSMVLLKNTDSVLPVDFQALETIAVIGPNADNKDSLLGNYNGVPSHFTTPLAAIRNAVGDNTRVYYAEGCPLAEHDHSFWGRSPRAGFSEALAAAERADIVIMCLGLSPALEGEEGATAESDGGGDRIGLNLPGLQQELLETVAGTEKPIVLVLLNGSPITLGWAQDNIPAILEAWYPGQRGGKAVVDVLTGTCNPAGRLPVTFVRSIDELPPFTDYAMTGRTYRYLESPPLYPFGYGLSYTRFDYADLTLSSSRVQAGESLTASVTVSNLGPRDGEEVVQLYREHLSVSTKVPRHELRGVRRVEVPAGEGTTVEFRLGPEDMAYVTDEGHRVIAPGFIRLYVGGQQPDERSRELTGEEPLSAKVEIVGSCFEVGERR